MEKYSEQVEDSIAFVPVPHAFFVRAKAKCLVEWAERTYPGSEPAVLDFGCGIGLTDEIVKAQFTSLYGIDVDADSVEQAKKRNPTVHYSVRTEDRLPYDDASFDLIFTICVFHHIDKCDRPANMAELQRVLKPGGFIHIYEHNPINPLTQLAVFRCPFDEGVELLPHTESKALFEGANLVVDRRNFILFCPFEFGIAQRLERYLSWLPLGAQYQIIGRKPD